MGVMMQAFYWDCPKVDNKEFVWWDYIQEKIPSLAEVGISALWLPPVHKPPNINGPSMGYDPYDYYDLGEFEQKGSVKTWFGSKQALLKLIELAHRNNLAVIADMVLNHNNGADEQEVNQRDGKSRWTLFNKIKSEKFFRSWDCFHPSPFKEKDEGAFGDMPDLSHSNPYVYAEIIKLAKWLVEEIGFDGFRYDFVKGYNTWLIKAIQKKEYTKNGQLFKPYGVGENWSGDSQIEYWLNQVNEDNDNPIDAFDFPLRYKLKELCDTFGFSLRELLSHETVFKDQPFNAVTFVDNHDFREREGPEIVQDKLLAYSFILTHEGYPCVYWKDYYNYGLAQAGTPHGINALIKVHEDFAGGSTNNLWVDDNLYIMERTGWEDKPGLIFVLNNTGDGWNGAWVSTQWQNIEFKPVAWWSAQDNSTPANQFVHGDGRGNFSAPPRGYTVYAPQA
ncbi:MAG: alpha-amylase [Gomphosphaeria aponina SAG 52.96 = DSM 107014]|uniref:Alpha-amylase n=1 Tax=Gomphosphaeria aponina SAG 52.96 = DSM 107014 TaxID=1521640 RepID=A0A941GPJ7_9CHRO|nr:alpha-amylase [Gomphosphaeria aponina SAG 52.96 = DSM 107014]